MKTVLCELLHPSQYSQGLQRGLLTCWVLGHIFQQHELSQNIIYPGPSKVGSKGQLVTTGGRTVTLIPNPPRVQPTCDSLCSLNHLARSCNFGNHRVILPIPDRRPGPAESDGGRKSSSLEPVKNVASGRICFSFLKCCLQMV